MTVEEEEFTLLAPHVHEWRQHKDRRAWTGPIEKAGPPIFCDCGEQTGNWKDVNVLVTLESPTVEWRLSELFPDGLPDRVTIDAVTEALDATPRSDLLESFPHLEAFVQLGGTFGRVQLH